MGTPINTPFTSELWHLTIDDLLEPLPASPRLGGPGPFVINLSASTAPISLPMKSIAECPGAHVYQVQRTEDRRVRYRLRFGPFKTEEEAEALLSVVREIYPSALAATAEPDDLRAIESIKAKIEAQQLAAVKAAMSRAAAAAPIPAALRASAEPAPAEPPAVRPSMPSMAQAPVAEETAPFLSAPPPAWLALRASTQAPTTATPAAAAAEKAAPMMKTAADRSAVPARASGQAAPAIRAAEVPAPEISSAGFFPAAEAGACESGAGEPVRPLGDPVIPVLSDVAVTRPAPRAAVPPLVSKAFTPGVATPGVATPGIATQPPAPRTSSTAAAPPQSPPATVRTPVAPRPATPMAMRSVSTPSAMRSVSTPMMMRSPSTPCAKAPPVSAATTGPASEPAPVAAVQNKVSPTVPARRVEALSTPLASLDTTQTLRPLTAGEIEDAQALRWFSIQLSLADQRFDPDALPNLDIFSEYRLYSISVTDQGRPMHALRLGFFSEEGAAAAVAGYLGAFYDQPVIKRISVAERERFSVHRLEARKDIGATGKHAVIEITDERVIRPKRPDVPTPAGSPRSFGTPMDKGK